jgi:hypothetical protein
MFLWFSAGSVRDDVRVILPALSFVEKVPV